MSQLARLLLLALWAPWVLAGCDPPEDVNPYTNAKDGDGGSSLPPTTKGADGGTSDASNDNKEGGVPAGPCKTSFSKEILKQIDQA